MNFFVVNIVRLTDRKRKLACWSPAIVDVLLRLTFSEVIACLFCSQGLLRCLILTAYMFWFSCLSKKKNCKIYTNPKRSILLIALIAKLSLNLI